MSTLGSLGCIVLERGWLSSNNVVFPHGQQVAVVDTGYCTHSEQTLFLLSAALNGRSLDLIVNTHLHSDHCGGNASLMSSFPNARLSIPPGQAHNVAAWNADALSYEPTGQLCPPFMHHEVLVPGQNIFLGDVPWDIHAAPGHDAHSVILFEPKTRTLISADALWENGFGVVFQELEGIGAFDEVAATLDLIERLAPLTVIPGHGRVFTDTAVALSRARSRLEMFMRDPARHAQYGAKVLLKYKLLELQQCSKAQLLKWTVDTPYFNLLHARFFADQSHEDWVNCILLDLHRAQALDLKGDLVINRD